MSTEAQQQASDISQMSDDEILNMAPPPATQNTPEATELKEQTEPTAEEIAAQEQEAAQRAAEEARLAQEEADRVEQEKQKLAELENKEADTTISTQEENGGKVAPTKVESNDGKGTDDPSKSKPEPAKEGDDKSKQEGEKETPKSGALPADFDYKAGYEALMRPFKANGKMVQVRSPEEAIALMQQGANFTRKMQELAPHRKLIQMLQNNDMLDEGQLSYAIDLVKKNPEAIKKLIKDSGIDPMDIDVNAEVQYKEGNHRVSDAEVRFNTELGDLKSSPEGNATLGVIHQTWDDASKQALFETPGLMGTIHQQRESGIYTRIVDEMEHLKTLGKIGADVPFIHAYKAVGDFLMQQGGFDDLIKPKTNETAAPAATAQAPAQAPAAPVATRVVTPKPAVTNGEQANAASPSRNAPRKAEALVNLLGMSDEDFLKLPVPKGA